MPAACGSEESNMSENKPEAAASEPIATGEVKLEKGRVGLVGIKAGMTHVYAEDGAMIPVTVIDLRPNKITQIRTKEKDGYSGIQVGLIEKAEKKASKSEQGHAKKSGGQAFGHYQEFRFEDEKEVAGAQVGQTLSPEIFKEGDTVDVMAVSKGKGFQGVIKRHHFGGNFASHGNSLNHRMPGSISSNRQIGMVVKGKRMAGHMGHERVTTQNLKVVRVDAENRVLLIKGSVPGPRSGIVTIQRAVKSL